MYVARDGEVYQRDSEYLCPTCARLQPCRECGLIRGPCVQTAAHGLAHQPIWVFGPSLAARITAVAGLKGERAWLLFRVTPGWSTAFFGFRGWQDLRFRFLHGATCSVLHQLSVNSYRIGLAPGAGTGRKQRRKRGAWNGEQSRSMRWRRKLGKGCSPAASQSHFAFFAARATSPSTCDCSSATSLRCFSS